MMRATLKLCVALVILIPTIGAAQDSTSGPITDLDKARDEILGLERAKLPYLALQAARSNPGAVNDVKFRQLEADYAAELTRLAVITTRQESERFRIADRALAIYDELIPQWQALGDSALPQLNRIRIDRLEALRARYRLRDVIAEYEALQRDGVPLTNYALANVADAYLNLRQPEKARELYERIFEGTWQTSPETRLENQIGLFYALVEVEEHEKAREVMQAAVNEQPIWLTVKGNPQRLGNPLRLDAEHTEALSYLYAEDTEEAEERLSTMVTAAPNNASLRTSMAAVYRAREQPRRASRELKLAETMAPRAITVVAEQAHAAMDLGEWEQAEILVNDAHLRLPEHTLTKNAMRRWRTHNKAELQITAQGGLISDTPVAGQNDLTLETVLYSAPINHNWRPFAGVGYSHGEFDEGITNYRWMRAGIQWYGKGLTAELEGSAQRYGHGTKTGVRAMAYYELNDHWQVGGAAAFRSTETPVRALHHNVTSNSVGAFARWRANERREWSLTTSAARFSDHNKRFSMYLSGRERIYTSPKLKADAELGVYASRNTLSDAPYFNPRSDIEVVPALKLTHSLYRRYERALEHSLTLGAGVYGQRGYGAGAVATAAYGMRYQHSNDFAVGATIVGTTRPYDGQRERELRFMLDMNIRF